MSLTILTFATHNDLVGQLEHFGRWSLPVHVRMQPVRTSQVRAACKSKNCNRKICYKSLNTFRSNSSFQLFKCLFLYCSLWVQTFLGQWDFLLLQYLERPLGKLVCCHVASPGSISSMSDTSHNSRKRGFSK